jgi:hypothetical protein
MRRTKDVKRGVDPAPKRNEDDGLYFWPKTGKHAGICLGKSPCWHLERIFVVANESADSVETQLHR